MDALVNTTEPIAGLLLVGVFQRDAKTDVVDLQEMAPLIAAFYEQADIPAIWEKHLPAMQQEAERYQKLLARIIQESNAYLRVDTSGYFGRRFAIYLNPLTAANQTDARSYGDNYYIVVSPSAELPEEEQDAIAGILLSEMEDEKKWAESFRNSPDVLEKMSQEALKEIRAGMTEPLDPEKL